MASTSINGITVILFLGFGCSGLPMDPTMDRPGLCREAMNNLKISNLKLISKNNYHNHNYKLHITIIYINSNCTYAKAR